MFKRLIALFLLVMMIGMTACGKDAVQEETPATPVPVTPTVMPTKEPVPAVEDSIFDEPTEPAQEEEKLDAPAVEEETQEPVITPAPQAPSEPEASVPENGGDNSAPQLTEYELFQALSPADQRTHMESFSSMDAFFAWYNAAKDYYEQQNPSISVGDGNIDLGEIAGKNN